MIKQFSARGVKTTLSAESFLSTLSLSKMSVYCVYIKLCASVGVLRNYARLEHKGQGQEEQEMARGNTNKKVLEGFQ